LGGKRGVGSAGPQGSGVGSAGPQGSGVGSAGPQGKRETPLLDAHQRLGARIVTFGGWDMPLQYQGVVAEHNAVRNAVGVFDVSHLGKLRVTGPDGTAALQHAVTANIEVLEVGAATYALVLNDEGGSLGDSGRPGAALVRGFRQGVPR
jgi:Aminomethyltransferase folate-binding domain